MYHYVTVEFVMRGADSNEEAIQHLADLLPRYPDENTTYMESWQVVESVNPTTGERLNDPDLIDEVV